MALWVIRIVAAAHRAIPSGHSSRPNWIVFGNAGTAINYCSLPNPLAQGVITITS